MSAETQPTIVRVPVGTVVVVNGVAMRHIGGGHFEPVAFSTTELAKRFSPAECGPLLGRGQP
jgi:hypothetical protein